MCLNRDFIFCNVGQVLLLASSFCSCLQVSFYGALFNAFRKEDLIKVLAWTEKLLILTIVAHSRRDISPQSLFKWLSGVIKVNSINNGLSGLSPSVGRGCLCVGICIRAGPFMVEWTLHSHQHSSIHFLTRGFPQLGELSSIPKPYFFHGSHLAAI